CASSGDNRLPSGCCAKGQTARCSSVASCNFPPRKSGTQFLKRALSKNVRELNCTSRKSATLQNLVSRNSASFENVAPLKMALAEKVADLKQIGPSKLALVKLPMKKVAWMK